jgi:hypothetical protein
MTASGLEQTKCQSSYADDKDARECKIVCHSGAATAAVHIFASCITRGGALLSRKPNSALRHQLPMMPVVVMMPPTVAVPADKKAPVH